MKILTVVKEITDESIAFLISHPEEREAVIEAVEDETINYLPYHIVEILIHNGFIEATDTPKVVFPDGPKYMIHENVKKELYFTLHAANGQEMMYSNAYANRMAVDNAIEGVKKWSQTDIIDDSKIK